MQTRTIRTAIAAITVGSAFLLPLTTGASAQTEVPSIIPAPTSLSLREGRFTIDASTRIAIPRPDSALHDLATWLAVPLRAGTGLAIPISDRTPGDSETGVILLDLRQRPGAAPESRPYDRADGLPEDYTIDVTASRVTLSATTHAGLFRGLQTLRQLLPPAFEDAYAATHGRDWRSDESADFGAARTPRGRPPLEGTDVRATAAGPGDRPAGPFGASTIDETPPAGAMQQADWSIPAVSIRDQPRFSWRGMHLDVGRHLFAPAFIRKYIDLIASLRMNVFHWHLTEDQGWRLEIAKYPRLAGVGAWRSETILDRNFDPYIGDGVPYGGFYTQDEVRDIVEYAASRYVTIVPEIEMPGHSVAALAAYPELGCTPGPFEVATVWGVTPDIYCPSERTFEFLEDVLTEVIRLFPGRFIHIGGDEAPKTAWERSDLAQEVIRREGLADEQELQSWFIRRIERFLSSRGRRLIGWDEILEGGLAPEATVMSWRGVEGGIDAARQGHDVVMTPNSHLYFDYYQGDPAGEPLAIGGFLPLDVVYGYEPVPAVLTPEEAAHVLGPQGNLWTEYVATPDRVEYMALPRMLALAEVAWSPARARDWADFLERLPAELDRLDRLGVDYRLPGVEGLGEDRLTLGDTVRVRLSVPIRGAVIRYTLDGSTPDVSSPANTEPLVIPVDAAGVVVSARAIAPGGRESAVSSARFAKATLRAPDHRDRAGLDGGLRVAYYEGAFRSADDVRALDALRTGVAERVGLTGDERAERFGLRFTGYVYAPADGIFGFALSSDDGSRLRVGGELVIDHDGPHGTSTRTGQIALAAGWHAIEVTYYQAGGGRSIDLEMAPPGEAYAPMAANRLAHDAGGETRKP